MPSLTAVLEKLSTAAASVATVSKTIVEDAYKQGFEAGVEAMRARMVKAACLPVAFEPAEAFSIFQETARSVSKTAANELPLALEAPPARAPRGSVRRFVHESLLQGGATLKELQTRADLHQVNLSHDAFGTELRRNENTMYRRDRENRWFLISGDAMSNDVETAEPPTTDNSADHAATPSEKEAQMEPP